MSFYPIIRRWSWASLLCLALATALGAGAAAAQALGPALAVTLLYPGQTTTLEMGQALRIIARVTDARGSPVTDGQLTVTVQDPKGQVLGVLEASPDSQGTYRGGPWIIPHRISEGAYRLSLAARRGEKAGEASGSLKIAYSISDILLNKYGFWLAAPTLRAIDPQLVAEKGNAQDGMIRWGGFIPAQHVIPESWVEVHWRHGRYDLSDAAAVRRFVLGTIGDLGITPIRSVGPFTPFRFKGWDGWKVGGRGRVAQNQVEWVAFYAPEVDKTYLIGTMVTLPPVGIDPHAALRDSFEVHPEVHGAGVAPEALPRLQPGPELLAPPMGTRLYGTGKPIILRWQPVKSLAPDEYYQVSVDYDYRETNTSVVFTTRGTQLALPESLYRKPNCGVFNWQVTLMRRDGRDSAGRAISHPSLYWYVEWYYPPGVEPPFTMACPNAQT